MEKSEARYGRTYSQSWPISICDGARESDGLRLQNLRINVREDVFEDLPRFIEYTGVGRK
jgi:hypothetical protein